MIANLTYEELITSPNGIHVSRALVNVIIDRQIGQQLSVGVRLILFATVLMKMYDRWTQ